MRFSLRWLLAFIVVICLILGSREACRSYHWHRTLPVEFPMANENGKRAPYSLVAEVRFGKANADYVRDKAASQRKERAREMVQYLKDEGFFESLAFMSCNVGRKTLPLYQKAFRTELVENANFPKPFRANRLTCWLKSRDQKAIDWVAEELRKGDPGRVRLILSSLTRCREYPSILQYEVLRSAIAEYLRGPSVVEEFVEWALRRVDFADQELASLIADRDRFSLRPATVAKYQGLQDVVRTEALAAENLLARLRFLGSENWGITEKHAVATVVALQEEVKANQDRVEYRNRDIFDEYQKAIFALATQLGPNRRNEGFDKNARHEFAKFCFEQNDFSTFLVLADRKEQDNLDWLYRNRERLAFVDAGNPALHTKISSDQQNLPQQFYETLLHPKSGFDRPFDLDLFAMVLTWMDEDFAKPRMLKLMEEDVGMAFCRAGAVWHGTQDQEVLELLMAKYEKLNKQATDEASYYTHEVYDAIRQVSPTVAAGLPRGKRTRSGAGLAYPEPEGTMEELESCLNGYGLAADFDGSAYWLDSETSQVFVDNQRMAQLTRSDPFMLQCESILNASVGVFEPDVSVQPVEGLPGRKTIEVALEDRVYGFEINTKDHDWNFQLCDIYNHILERERISHRFLVLQDEDVYFGEPELFKELNRRFGIRFAKGAEFYFPEKGKDAK